MTRCVKRQGARAVSAGQSAKRMEQRLVFSGKERELGLAVPVWQNSWLERIKCATRVEMDIARCVDRELRGRAEGSETDFFVRVVMGNRA
jgi:hypothetical protein